MSQPTPSASSALCDVQVDRIALRGRDLCTEILGHFTFTQTIFLLLFGRSGSAAEIRLLDAVLNTLAEHGMTPQATATRLTFLAAPESIQGAIAAGLLGVGGQFGGTAEGCARLLRRIAAAPDPAREAAAVADDHRARKAPVPGFGHPHHRPDDPRAPRLLAIADETGLAGRQVAALRLLAREVDRAWGRHVTINATGAIAALLGELDLPGPIMRGLAVVSRAAGLLAHIREELERPAAPHLWRMAEREVPYRPDGDAP